MIKCISAIGLRGPFSENDHKLHHMSSMGLILPTLKTPHSAVVRKTGLCHQDCNRDIENSSLTYDTGIQDLKV